jgi:hypothetical protein
VPVRRVQVHLGAHAHRVPAYLLALLHLHHRHVAKDVTMTRVLLLKTWLVSRG